MTSTTVPDGVEVLAPADGAILAPDALALVARLQRELGPTRAALLARRQERQAELDAGAKPGFLDATRGVRDGDWRVAAGAAGPRGPPRRDHRPGRAQDDDQRAQLRRARVHGGLRGRVLADVDERRGGAAQRPRRGPPGDRPRHGGEAVPAERGDRDPRDSPARLAPPGAPPPRRRRARVRRRSSTSGSGSGTTAPSCSSAAPGRTSTCRSSSRTRRRGSGTTRSSSRRTGSASRAARCAPPC